MFTVCPAPAPAPADPAVDWRQGLPICAPMPQSLSTIERSNPPPRRKSCAGCIKAKRRCTLEDPACQRCTQRSLDCMYPSGRALRKRLPITPSITDTSVLAADALVPGWGLPAWNTTCLGGLQPMQAEPHQLVVVPPGPHPTLTAPIICSLDGLAPILEVPDIIPLDHLAHFPSEMPPLHTDRSETVPKKADEIVLACDPVSLDTGGTIQWFVQHRLQYAIDKIRDAPRQMVLENQTPWCHPCLYQESMPRSMQDAHSSCALSMAKNAVNADIIARSIESRVQELVATPMPGNPHEVLARAHALLLYQIIRIFDGNLHSGAAAEGTTQALEDSAFALLNHIVFDEAPAMSNASDRSDAGFYSTPPTSDLSHPSPPSAVTQANTPTTASTPTPSPGPQTPQHLNPQPSLPLDLNFYPLEVDTTRTFWHAWIFQESARRTVVIIFWFIQCYRSLRGRLLNSCPGRLAEVRFSFTMSEQLWRAQDPLGFSMAWCSGRRFVIRDESFVTAGGMVAALGDARADEVDVFSRILVSSFLGIQKTKGWLMSVGGDL